MSCALMFALQRGLYCTQTTWGSCVEAQAPCDACRRSALLGHQLVEGHRCGVDLGLAEHEVGDVIFDHHRLDLCQSAVVAEVPTHNVRRLLVTRGEFVDMGLDLLRL